MTQTFTPIEANKMLPLIRSITLDIMSTWDQIIVKRTKLDTLEKGSMSEDALAEIKQELNYLIDKTNDYIKEVERLGCFVEEFKRGVINFPALRSGRKVFLCWMPTDPKIDHWHEMDETCNYRVKL